MNINEAIERLAQRVDGEFFCVDPGNVDDFKLGIEALKRHQTKRELGIHYDQTPLPGETKE